MPRRQDIKSILILGAGPIVIGQACEFDYSGVQACKALKEENYRVILVNSNPATIMTDYGFADATYIEPIDWQTVEKIIEKERPDAILPTMGGQTGLNCALDLCANGVLDRFQVEMIGATKDAIDKAEDRERFRDAMARIGLETVPGELAKTLDEAKTIQAEIGFPTIIRPSFTLGGTGGGIAYNMVEFETLCQNGFDASPTHELLIESSIMGWKEYEMEVVRDCKDNCIIICSIENLDPMGVHTGDSITVAPAQTLTDKEYQIMRNASISVLREIGVDTGGSNVQFAVDPENGRCVVIEMNPRVSRSSALASKATGFPIAKVAAKLAVGYTLDELDNEITGGVIPASFEPTLDYVVTKIPRFDFDKFRGADRTLTTQMRSVGEVMAIGRSFQESLQKALQSLEIGSDGFTSAYDLDQEAATSGIRDTKEHLETQIRIPSAIRLWYVAEGFRQGWSLSEIFQLSRIDPWFLGEIQDIILCEQRLSKLDVNDIDEQSLRVYKQKGFSDLRLSKLLKTDEETIRKRRYDLNVYPVYKRVDSCAAEFDTLTAYLYSTYEEECEANPTSKSKIMILGGGPNRIGQGIEFDYCCVHASMALRSAGYETIMVNCNPETVSTDYDISDRLYFEPITLEKVLDIVQKENPQGVIVQFGGQTPLKLAQSLKKHGVPIIGTSPESIHKAEDREAFKELVQQLQFKQPDNATAKTVDEAVQLAHTIGYPLVIRPSYVLGGRAMEIVQDETSLLMYMQKAKNVSNNSPVLLDRFLNDAVEVDVDAVCDATGEVVIGGIMQHIEEAGVHSGDSACSLPPFSISEAMQSEIKKQTIMLAKKINVVGLINIQFAIQNDNLLILEANPRASRTIPFVSKSIGEPLAKIASLCMVGVDLKTQKVEVKTPKHFNIKEAVFPFMKFSNTDVLLGPEMRSTGEVMGIGANFGTAFYKAQRAAGNTIPKGGPVLFSLKKEDQLKVLDTASYLLDNGFSIFATSGTAQQLRNHGLSIQVVNKVREGRPHVVDAIKNREYVFILNTTSGKQSIVDSYTIRREALLQKVTYFTTLSAAYAAIEAHKIMTDPNNEFTVTSLQDWCS